MPLGTGERIFDAAVVRMPVRALTPGVVFGSRTEPSRVNLEASFWAAGSWVYRFVQARPAALVALAGDELQRGGCDTATIHTGGTTSHLGMAAIFASHLCESRASLWKARPQCLVSGTRIPAGRGDLVQVPHLVAVAGSSGAIGDLVVWELVAPQVFSEWFAGGQDELAFFSNRLADLCEVRRMLREGALPSSELAASLTGQLEGRYLSMRFVLQHPELLRDVLRELGERR